MSARLSSWPPGGRPHARLKASTPRVAPTPAPTTKAPSPQQRVGTARGPNRSNAESTNLQTIGVEGRTALPLEPRVNTEIRPTRAAKLEPERTTGCKSMRGPRPASGTPPDCSGETCSLSEETKAPQRQQLVPPATRHDRPREPATLPSAVQAVGVPAVVCVCAHGFKV